MCKNASLLKISEDIDSYLQQVFDDSAPPTFDT